MKNYAEHCEDLWANLQVKIFSGEPHSVETQINDWINNNPVAIKQTLQSESGDQENFGITLTVFYYREGTPRFISKQWGIEKIASFVMEYLQDQGMSIPEIADCLTWKKEETTLNKY